MRKLTLLLIGLFVIGTGIMNAQTKLVTGNVTSDEDGQPIPGVTIQVKGTSLGTTSDLDGNYSLNVPEDATTIVFSFVGMETLEMSIEGTSKVNVAMKSSFVGMDEVVVTALGLRREKKALGYASTSVNSEEMAQSAQSSVMNSLQGKVAGVNVSSTGGSASSSSKVIIRGYSSLSGGNNPLYVVDNMPISNATYGGNGTDFGNGANFINPEDVASVNILKGAAATALYGSRAANGVVIITTKGAQANEKINVEVTSRAGVSTPLRIPQMQNTFGQGWSGHWATDENGSWGPKMDGSNRLWGNTYENSRQVKSYGAVEDNIKDFYDLGQDYFNSIKVSQGSENANFLVSYSNTYQDGVIPTDVDKYNRNTLLAKGSMKNKWLTVSGSMNFINRNGSNTPDGTGGTAAASNLFSELLQIPRDFSIIDFKDYENNPFNSPSYFYTPYATNPYYALNENKNTFQDNRFISNVSAVVDLTSWLSATARLGSDVTNYQSKDYEAIMEWLPNSPQANKAATENPGLVSESMRTNTLNQGDFLLNGQFELNKDFSLDAMVGYSALQQDYYRLSGSISSLTIPNYYNLSNTSGTKETSTYESMKRTQSVFGQASFDYQDKIYLNATARQDWSSTLPLNNNTFFYPSVSLAVSTSDLFPAIQNVFNYSKIRASWGKNGNDAPVYKINSTMIPGYVWHPFGRYEFPMAGVNSFEVSNIIGNPNLTPEISSEWEVGFEFQAFEGRISGDIGYYDKLTDGQILEATVAPSSGVTSQVKNFGKIQNVGLEALVSVKPIKTNNFVWDVTVNYTRNRNYVLELTDGLSEYVMNSYYNTEYVIYAPKEGEDKVLLGQLRVPEILRDDNGNVVVNDQGFPETTSDTEDIGTIQPDYMMGLSNTFTFKDNLKFGFSFDMSKGGYMYSGTADLNYFVGNTPQSMFNERQPFIIPNTVMRNPQYDADAAAADPNYSVAQYVENDKMLDMSQINNPLYYPSYNLASERDRIISKDYLKLREVFISYKLPQRLIASWPIESLEFTLTGRNLILWTPSSNNFVDPEIRSEGNDLDSEIGEFRTGPSYSTYSFGLNVKF